MSGINNYIGKKMAKRLKILLVFYFAVSTVLIASSEKYYDIVYRCYINNEMDKWEQVIMKMEKDMMPQNSVEALYQLTFTIYGYVGYCLSIEDKEKAELYISKAEVYLDVMLKKRPDWAEVLALKSAFYGFKIGVSPYKVMYYGPKSYEYLSKAYDLSSGSWQVLLEKGNVEYYMPSVFGGSKKEAIRFYSKAIDLMELKNEHKGNWVYLSTLTMLAHAYELVDNIEMANKTYLKILRTEPNYLWVKDELYPEFTRKYQL